MPSLIIKENTEITGTLYVSSSVTSSRGVRAIPGMFYGNLVGTASYYPVNETLFICASLDPGIFNYTNGTQGMAFGVPVPYSPRDGTTTINWKVRRINAVYSQVLNGNPLDGNNPLNLGDKEHVNHRIDFVTSSLTSYGVGQTGVSLHFSHSYWKSSSFGSGLGSFTQIESGKIIGVKFHAMYYTSELVESLSLYRRYLTCTVELSNDNIPLP